MKSRREPRTPRHTVSRLAGLAALPLCLMIPAACANLSGLSDGRDAGSPDTGVKHVEAGSDASTGHDVGTRKDAASHDAGRTDAGHPVDAGREAAVEAGPPASCVAPGPGRTNCGADAGESCCTSLTVAAGTFQRAYTASDAGVSSAAASVSAFRLDKYPVTVGRFREFIQATNPSSGIGWAPPVGSGKHGYLDAGALNACPAGTGPDGGLEQGWLASFPFDPTPASVMVPPVPTYTLAPGANENLPMNEVSWYVAYAFCIWDGGFLPTLAELEYAAAGGNEQRLYPWGSTPPESAPNQYSIYGCHYPRADADIPDGDTCEDANNIAPVGTARLGLGRWQQLDLCGEITEWVLDKYEGAYVDSEWRDCAYLAGDAGRNFEGTSWALPFFTLPAARAIGGHVAGLGDPDVGIRCARAP
jgi:formylglycine-generating enzyme required for sulfatase activity